MFRFLFNSAMQALPASLDSSRFYSARRRRLLPNAILAAGIAFCFGFISPNDAAATEHQAQDGESTDLASLFFPNNSWAVEFGVDVGQLNRASTGTLGADDGVMIDRNNLLFMSNEDLFFLYKLDLIHRFWWGESVWDINFGVSYGTSDVDQRIDFVSVGAGNNLLIFSPQGQSGGLGGGLNAGPRDAEDIRYSNEYEVGEARFGINNTIANGPGWNVRAGPIFGFGYQYIDESIDGDVVGINQMFMYRNMADVMTYTAGGRLAFEYDAGTIRGRPVEIYGDVLLAADIHDNDGYSMLTLNGLVNAEERQNFGGSETTTRFQVSAGFSIDLGENTEAIFGGSYKRYDTPRIDIAPEKVGRITYDGADEYTFYARFKLGFGPPVHESPILNGVTRDSDRRLKRDITYLTMLDKGITLYSFKYLWDDQVYVGVMAQDLLENETFRDAVVLRANGFYAVDYARLGLKMTTLKAWQESGLASVMLTPASGRYVSSIVAAPAH